MERQVPTGLLFKAPGVFKEEERTPRLPVRSDRRSRTATGARRKTCSRGHGNRPGQVDARQPPHGKRVATKSQPRRDRKSDVKGTSVSVGVDIGGRRVLKKKK